MKWIYYVLIGLLGIGVVVGMVLFLRSRNAAPLDVQIKTPTTKTSVQTKTQGKTLPFQSLDEVQKIRPYQPGDPKLPEGEYVDTSLVNTNQ